MPAERPVRTSLEVGFPGEGPPAEFLKYRGAAMRSIPASLQFPYEDAQFEVVMMDGSAVSRETVKEAHRVLKPDGNLVFTVPEREGIPARRTGRSKLPVSLSARTAMNLSRVIELARTAGTMAKKKSWKSSPRARTNTYKKNRCAVSDDCAPFF